VKWLAAVFAFLTAQLTDDVPQGAPDWAQMPKCAKGATAERRLAGARFAPLGFSDLT
jgi:hypothetical protein